MSTPNRRGVLFSAAGAAAGLAIAPTPAFAASQSAGRREPLAAGPGKKWDLDGNAQRFRGNTFVCPVPQDSAFFHAETEAIETMKRSSIADQYVCLPRQSMHMTVFDATTQDTVTNKQLPAWLADCTDVSEVSQRILARLQESTLTPVGPITMKVKGFGPFDASFTMQLTPADDATFNTLWTIRRELSALLEIRAADFETYQFHSTLGYRLVKPLPSDVPPMERLAAKCSALFTGDAATVTMEHPAFNLFDDMLAFPQLWQLPKA
ncbi:conserved hypothetical protein [Streptomyces himastatinicus ATCC 53653]|uniref:DUF1868 domain-containing protein n=1 Tax=Streptomyces himastatinicus ATCC 53653 TaxID=457427 RepID=D9WM79_9ACTN|nr:DUF1868 domain-containing protein [Streptomyces himastatinicus]EFL25782.1 conserved hypothetical protein [Streptomyces himastatinicus ATCC 53653]